MTEQKTGCCGGNQASDNSCCGEKDSGSCCTGKEKSGCCMKKCDPRTAVSVLSLLVAAGALFYAFSTDGTAYKPKSEPGKVVAKLNGKAITEGDVKNMVLEQAPSLPMDQIEKALPQLTEQYINMQLIDTAARSDKTADTDAIKKQIEAAKKQILRGAFLQANAEGKVTQDALAAAYAEAYPNNLMVEYKASHILVKEEAKATDILNQLKNGADFAKFAKDNSIDTGSADKGGDLGYFPLRAMVKPFADAIAAKGEKGLIELPVKSNFGFHIIRVEDKREKPAPSMKEAERALRQELAQKNVEAVIQSLRSKAKIEIVTDAVAPAAPAAPTPPAAHAQ